MKTLKEKSAEIRFEVFDQKHALEIFSNIKITSRLLFDPLPVPKLYGHVQFLYIFVQTNLSIETIPYKQLVRAQT